MDEDNEEVHPPFICRDSCHKTLQADISSMKAFKQKKKGSGSKKPSKVIRGDFEPHELSITSKGECRICSLRRSPRKKARTEAEILVNESRCQGESSSSSSIPGPSAQKKLDFLPTSEQISNESTRPSSTVSKGIKITSYPLERFENGDFAELVFCVICLGVPSDPCITTCNHIFCKNCIF